MKIRKYTTIDVHYKESEQKEADEKQKQLKKLGYSLNFRDSGSEEYDYCDQYIKFNNTEIKQKEPCNCEYVMKGDVFRCRFCNDTIGNWMIKSRKK